MKKRKLQEELIAHIENYLKEKKGVMIIIKMIKDHMINSFSALPKISYFTIRSVLM